MDRPLSFKTLWHPFTQHGLGLQEIQIDSARGAYLQTHDGRKILDAISSWWVNTHGHGNKRIAAAVQNQAQKLDQVIFAGFTNDAAQKMAQRFIRLLKPRMPDLEHIFLSDSGSTAVEAAIKMAIGYHKHNKTGKNQIIALKGGYHGDTMGAMSVSDKSAFTSLYEPYLFNVAHVSPHNLNELEDALKKQNVAALIVEPLIQGAGCMNMYGAQNLADMAALCKRHGALLIADEIMTGWGRTGTLFACEQANITPDILCTSKGITGGFLGLSAVLSTRDIYKSFYSKDRGQMFFHSSSYTGNALACAAGAENMAIWLQEPVFEKIQKISDSHKNAISRLAGHKNLYNVRHCGTILAAEIGSQSEGYTDNITTYLYQEFLKRDILLRPIGNTIYILPPYCIITQELEKIYCAIESVANQSLLL